MPKNSSLRTSNSKRSGKRKTSLKNWKKRIKKRRKKSLNLPKILPPISLERSKKTTNRLKNKKSCSPNKERPLKPSRESTRRKSRSLREWRKKKLKTRRLMSKILWRSLIRLRRLKSFKDWSLCWRMILWRSRRRLFLYRSKRIVSWLMIKRLTSRHLLTNNNKKSWTKKRKWLAKKCKSLNSSWTSKTSHSRR